MQWGWYLSANTQLEVIDSIKDNTNCVTTGKVYECFKDLSTTDVYNSFIATESFNVPWKPVPDNDFLPESLKENATYELSKRFVECIKFY